jgi:hypothetical protein
VKNAAVVLLLLAVALWLFVRARPQPPLRTTPAASTVRPTAPPPSPVTSPGEPPPAVSRDDSRTEELLRANASLEPDPDLVARYRDIDVRYFGRALPAASLRWEPRLAEVGPMIAESFRLEGATDGHLIILNPDIRANEQELKRALCHEMVHVAVWTQDRGHGPVFQRFLRDLADQGAFEGVVATDEEKQALRSTLDARAAALRSEAEALRTARAEADAAPGSLRTDRAVAYNRRVEEYNASVADFNQLAGRYNLMIVYPDGLDRERVERRPVFADTGGR